MQIFETIITVKESDLDELNHVNNVGYVQWVNDVAIAHWKANASDDILKQYFWVMVSHQIDYKRSALLNEAIKLKTFIVQSGGAGCTRAVEIYNNKTNKLLAKSETKWCFMSFKTLRPTRITQEIVDLFN